MNPLEQLRQQILERKIRQNARRAKAGKPPMHPELLKPKKPKASKATKPPPPESGDEDDTALSFDEWKDSGFSVRKGEKCQSFDVLGIPQFTRLQVQKTNPSWQKFRKRSR